MHKILKRMNEIRTRMAEIRAQLEGEGEVNLDELDNELRNLETEYNGLEQRRTMFDRASAGSPEARAAASVNPITGNVGNPGGETPPPATEERFSTPEEARASKAYRSAFAKKLMGRRLTQNEQRALDVATTTTAIEYVEPTASVDGVNNGGLFIPTSMNLALLEHISQISPIFRDAAKTQIPGLIEFPYKETSSGAKSKRETEKNGTASIKWGKLTLGISEISETIRTTWRLEAMSVDGFLTYLEQELKENCTDKAAIDSIYGTGNEEMKGVTKNAVSHPYTGNALDAIGEGIKKLSNKLRIGAKLYVAQSIADEISFSKDDQGRYIFTPINNVGIRSISTYVVEVDPYLNDGDFIFGNVSRRMRINISEDFSITRDRIGSARANDYTGFCLMAGAAHPNTLVYGHKSA